VKFTVLVDIKTPETSLLHERAYRNTAYAVSGELSGFVYLVVPDLTVRSTAATDTTLLGFIIVAGFGGVFVAQWSGCQTKSGAPQTPSQSATGNGRGGR